MLSYHARSEWLHWLIDYEKEKKMIKDYEFIFLTMLMLSSFSLFPYSKVTS